MPIKGVRHRRAVKARLFARDYADREGRWGGRKDPYWGKRKKGTVRWIRCYYCGEYVKVAGAVIAHKVAACVGGSDELGNLALAHDACNNEEGRRYNQLPGGGYPAMMGRIESDEA